MRTWNLATGARDRLKAARRLATAERSVAVRHCERCAEGFTSASGKQRYCSVLCCQRAIRGVDANVRDLICPCGKAFTATMKSRRWCSPECREGEHTARRNHLRRGATASGEVITVAVLGARDGWRCHLCSRRVPQAAAYPHPLSGSIDHIVPVSDGGAHALVNVALAHLRCNVARSTGGTVQLRAIA